MCEVGQDGAALGSECGIPGEVQAAWYQHMGRFKAGRLDEPSQETVEQEGQGL